MCATEFFRFGHAPKSPYSTFAITLSSFLGDSTISWPCLLALAIQDSRGCETAPIPIGNACVMLRTLALFAPYNASSSL